jgi:hypothetical protein
MVQQYFGTLMVTALIVTSEANAGILSKIFYRVCGESGTSRLYDSSSGEHRCISPKFNSSHEAENSREMVHPKITTNPSSMRDPPLLGQDNSQINNPVM